MLFPSPHSPEPRKCSGPPRVARHIIVAGGAQKALGAVRTMKQAPVATGTAAVTPRFQAPSLHASTTLPEGFSLIESFEGWDGQTSGWLPEGWTLRSEGSPELTDLESWGISGSNATFGISAPEGQYMMGISFATNEQDEWLETPTIEIAPNYELKFSAFIDPSFLFCLDNVDWDNMAFIGEPTIAATLKVMVQPEGGQWTELWDAVTPYLNMGLDELLYNHPAAWRNYTISLRICRQKGQAGIPLCRHRRQHHVPRRHQCGSARS